MPGKANVGEWQALEDDEAGVSAEEAAMHDPESRRIWRAAGATACVNILFLAGTIFLLASDNGNDGDDDGGVDKSSPVGWVSVLGAVWVFGSYGILIKLPEVAATDPQIFQVFFSLGAALSCCSVLITTPFAFSPWGFAGAALWIGSMLCAKVGIDGLGYGTAVAIWGSTTMVVSFLWGALVFGEAPDSPWGAAAALLVLGLGVAGVASAQSGRFEGSDEKEGGEGVSEGHAPLVLNSDGATETGVPGPDDVGAEAKAKLVLAGWLGALGCGLLNGSLMVPFRFFVQDQDSDGADDAIAYIVSFAIGVAVVQPVCFILYFRLPLQPLPSLKAATIGLPGIITGIFWAIGNFESTLATLKLGETVGYPLTQTCIVVAGLWGACFFNEIRGTIPMLLFSVSVLIIIGGAVLLGLYGA